MEYQIVFLKPGQQPPEGTTSIGVAGGIMCIYKDEKEFTDKTSTVKTGTITATDTIVDTKYGMREATQKEIDIYDAMPKQELVVCSECGHSYYKTTVSGVVDG